MPQTTGGLEETNGSANERLTNLKTGLMEFGRRHKSTLRTYGISTGLTLTAFAIPAAAQSGASDAESLMCGGAGGPNIGRIVMIVLALAAFFFILKGVFQGMTALDKMNSPREQEHLEGKEGLKSAGTSIGAALVPALAGPFFEIIGISTLSCIDWSLGVLMIWPFGF
ncbi:hypothetical protein GWG54_16140 [Natronococcus sp. JC468]|uniref:hypothetical protein n=1 Tax=Natronococcus sp. JC468 TaxID=1961921 RepID=UPI001438B8FC|nr:hypothetical protein [Natronococcus sp. JC468]NKE37319.1 hypothetical protein [Natronococcus sp. JC468]